MKITDNLSVEFITDKQQTVIDILEGNEFSENIITVDIIKCKIKKIGLLTADDLNNQLINSRYVWLKKIHNK